MTIELSNDEAQIAIDALCEYARNERNDARKNGIVEDSNEVVTACALGRKLLDQLKASK